MRLEQTKVRSDLFQSILRRSVHNIVLKDGVDHVYFFVYVHSDRSELLSLVD